MMTAEPVSAGSTGRTLLTFSVLTAVNLLLAEYVPPQFGSGLLSAHLLGVIAYLNRDQG